MTTPPEQPKFPIPMEIFKPEQPSAAPPVEVTATILQGRHIDRQTGAAPDPQEATPRTDAVWNAEYESNAELGSFARMLSEELEREAAALRKLALEKDEDITMLEAACVQHRTDNDALRRRVAELEEATRLCGKHQPTGGTRGMCVICAGEKLQYALSRISYACEEPNEMECSSYDVHMDEDAVIDQVKTKLAAEVEARRAAEKERDEAKSIALDAESQSRAYEAIAERERERAEQGEG